MKIKSLLIILLTILLSGCAVSRYNTVTINHSFDNYSYFYIIPTNTVTSSSGGIYGYESKSVQPEDIISGYLMKKNFVRLLDLESAKSKKAFVVSYGESGRHPQMFGYSIEITLQFLDASTNEVIATSTASGMGETEADDIRKAILQALQNTFDK